MRITVEKILTAYIRDNGYAGLQNDHFHEGCSCEPGEKFMACKDRCHSCYPVTKEEFVSQGFRPVPTPCDTCEKDDCRGCPEMEKELK
ncbi:hypothetical protein FACS189444_4140 [Spirochaetia bacterium]|nr:hypothetical protein FACS189444_4140 [Spirochaetia bacterium]